MKACKKNIPDFTIIIIFLIWGPINLFALITEHKFAIDLTCSIVFVILFEFSLKSVRDKDSRYNSLVKLVFLFNALLIATAVTFHFYDLPFSINGLEVVNIALPVQSIIFLYYDRRNRTKNKGA